MERKSNVKEKLVMAADIFFVLILCFIILFSTLVITNNISLNDYTVNGYRINILILAGVAVSIGANSLFMLTASLKGSKEVEEPY